MELSILLLLSFFSSGVILRIQEQWIYWHSRIYFILNSSVNKNSPDYCSEEELWLTLEAILVSCIPVIVQEFFNRFKVVLVLIVLSVLLDKLEHRLHAGSFDFWFLV